MTNKEFPKPRKVRNTAKQSILILGQPDFLYQIKDKKESFIIFDGKKKSLGNLADDIYLKLDNMCEFNNEIKLLREIKSIRKPVTKIEGFSSISIQKYKSDTMVVVSSADESTLIEKITKLKELLESKGAILQERCNWICIVDKGKTETSNEEILETEMIAKIKTEKRFCSPNMSDKTKALREMAIKAIKERDDYK